MFKNFLITCIRNIVRQKIYSFINIFGLAVGIALFIVIALYVKDELCFDRFNTKLDRIYRLELGDQVLTNASTAEFLQENFPEIEKVNRFQRMGVSLKYKNENYTLRDCALADNSVFDIFSFPFIVGDANTVFKEKNSIVLAETTARNLFGDENPIGKIVVIQHDYNYVVTGIIKDIPHNSSIKATAFVNFKSIFNFYNSPKEIVWNNNYNFDTYLLLKKGVNKEKFEKKLNEETLKYLMNNNNIESSVDYLEQKRNLRPLSEVYFSKGLKFDSFSEHGDKEFVFIFIAIGIFILVIACVNFINLTNARSSLRAKEIGTRKVLGATKKNLRFGFLSEAVFISLISTIIGAGVAELLVPVFNNVILSNVELNFTFQFVILLFLGGIIIGIFAGIYPSIVLSSKPLLSSIKGEYISERKGNSFRTILTVSQYVISIVLIIATLVVFKQLNYLKKKDLGFNKEQIVYLYLGGNENTKDIIKQKLLKNPNIKNVSFANTVLGRVNMKQGFIADSKDKGFFALPIDNDFINTFNIKVLKGRNILNNNENEYILNESATKMLDTKDLIGYPFKLWSRNEPGEIVGVVKDFNFRSLHHNIEPLVMYYQPDWCNRMFIKLSEVNIKETLSFIESTCNDLMNDFTFNYRFVDESFNRLYIKEQRYGKLFSYFALLAIFIASLGLFGMALFSISVKLKEISIRKVLGAKSSQIIFLFIGNFSKWIMFANLIGWPIGYIFMKKWLQNFAYKTSINWFVFVITLLISLFIAILTIFFQVYKAANTNPALILRDE